MNIEKSGYIKVESLYRLLPALLDNGNAMFLADDVRMALRLAAVETGDVAEVVRCKDCKYFGKDLGYGKHDCKKHEMPYCLENDYCSYGSRKTEEQRVEPWMEAVSEIREGDRL